MCELTVMPDRLTARSTYSRPVDPKINRPLQLWVAGKMTTLLYTRRRNRSERRTELPKLNRRARLESQTRSVPRLPRDSRWILYSKYRLASLLKQGICECFYVELVGSPRLVARPARANPRNSARIMTRSCPRHHGQACRLSPPAYRHSGAMSWPSGCWILVAAAPLGPSWAEDSR